MTRRSSADIGFLLIDGYDVLGVITQLEDSQSALTEETTAFGDDWTKHEYTNLKEGTLTQEGFFDTSTNSINDALAGNRGVERILNYNVEGNTIGKHLLCWSGALQVDYNKVVSSGELHKANASYENAGVVEQGLILHAHTERETDGDTESDPVQHGASSTDGGSAYLQVSDLSLDDYNDVLITVRERNGGTWADLQSFTAVTEAPHSERLEIEGNIEQDLAVKWEFRNGTGSNQSIKFVVGFVRN